jgi:hypothetical protein
MGFIFGKKGRTSSYRAIILLLLFLLVFLHEAGSLGTNAEIEENELGLTARACAANFCPNKTSLDIWIAIEWYCHAPEDMLPVAYRNMKSLQGVHYTRPVFAGFVCTVLGIFSFIIGFTLGVHTHGNFSLARFARSIPRLTVIAPRREEQMKVDDSLDKTSSSFFTAVSSRYNLRSRAAAGYVPIPEPEDEEDSFVES